MAENWRNEPALGDILLGLDHASGQVRNGDADVCRHGTGARTQRATRPIRVMPCLPEARAILRVRGPIEGTSTQIARNLPKTLGLLLHARRAAMKLHEKHRR